MIKCKYYHTKHKTVYTYNQYTGAPIANDTMVGECWGTKECEECSCEGNELVCDFYENVRTKAFEKLHNNK